jgi:uncharacterized protein YbaP (TraB family)
MKWRFLLLLTFLAPALPALGFTQEELCAENPAYVSISERIRPGLLFYVEKCGGASGFVFGTIHSDDPSLLEANPAVIEALKTSRLALFELVESQELQQEVARYMIYPAQQRDGLSHALGLDLYEQALTHMQRLQPEMPPAFFDRYRPWAAAILLQYPPQTADGVVMDARLQRLAIAQGIAIEGLETASEQFSFFQTLPLEEQRLMVSDAVGRVDEIRQTNRELFEAYRRKDLLSIQDIGETSFAAIEDPVFSQKLRAFLITDRNRTMVSRILPRLQEGGLFVAIGALHLTGDDGILSRLEDEGYFITQAD